MKKEKNNKSEPINLRKDFIDKTKPINLRKEKTIIDAMMNLEDKQEKGGYMTPSSPITHGIKSIFETAGTGRQVIANKNSNMNSKTDLYGNATYSYEGSNNSYEIYIDDYKKILTRQDKNTRKIFNFLLQKYNECHSEMMHFTLQEIVDRGIYKSKDTARRGVDKAVSKLMSIQITGRAKEGKKHIGTDRCPLVMKSRIYNSSWVMVDTELYSFLSRFFTILPIWADRLSAKAYSITDYIYYRARQELKSIKDKKCFTISLRTLSNHLAQPDPNDTQDHSKLIINPILEAIEEIEEAQREYLKSNKKGMSLIITPNYNMNYSGGKEFLLGNLNIMLDDETTKYFTDNCIKFEKKTQDNLKRVQALQEKKKATAGENGGL